MTSLNFERLYSNLFHSSQLLRPRQNVDFSQRDMGRRDLNSSYSGRTFPKNHARHRAIMRPKRSTISFNTTMFPVILPNSVSSLMSITPQTASRTSNEIDTLQTSCIHAELVHLLPLLKHTQMNHNRRSPLHESSSLLTEILTAALTSTSLNGLF